jgi:hypothetical protein
VDEGWADEIRARRFEIHNAAWLEAMSGGGGGLDSGARGGALGYSDGFAGGGGYDVYGAGDLDDYGLQDDGDNVNLDFDASLYGAVRQ